MIETLFKLWLGGFICACGFFGFVAFFKQGLLDSGELFDRVCDGRWIRDAIFWPVHFVGCLVPLFFVAAVVYPFAFTMRRLQIISVRRYRQR